MGSPVSLPSPAATIRPRLPFLREVAYGASRFCAAGEGRGRARATRDKRLILILDRLAMRVAPLPLGGQPARGALTPPLPPRHRDTVSPPTHTLASSFPTGLQHPLKKDTAAGPQRGRVAREGRPCPRTEGPPFPSLFPSRLSPQINSPETDKSVVSRS